MSLLSSWDEMDVRVKLLADDVWLDEDYYSGFLSIEVKCFYQLIFKNDQFPCLCYKLVLKTNMKWG